LSTRDPVPELFALAAKVTGHASQQVLKGSTGEKSSRGVGE